MKIQLKKKYLSAAIASVLMVSVIAMCSAALPPGVNPDLIPPDFTPYATFIYVTAGPNPAKLGGAVVLTAFIVPPPPTVSGIGGAGVAIQPTPYTNLSIVITTPTGLHIDSGNLTTGNSGATWYVYTPDALGTYSVVASWPGDFLHQAVTSRTVTFVVTEEGSSMYDYPGTPLPSGYWESPVSAEYREWAKLVGPWYKSAGFNGSNGCWNEYTTGPSSAHVLWKFVGGDGGLIGGVYGTQAYDRTERHDTNMHKKVVMNGRMYYALQAVRDDGVVRRSQQQQTSMILYCFDIRNGEEIWRLNPYLGGESPVGLPAVPMEGPQEVGVNCANIGSTLLTRQVNPGGVSRPFLLWIDATDGRIVRNVTMPTGYVANPMVEIGPYGTCYFYFAIANGNLTKWNPWKMQTLAQGGDQFGVATFQEGIVWTVPCGRRAPNLITGNRIVSSSGDVDFPFVGFDTDTGQLLYNVTHHDYNVASSTTSGYGKVFGMCSDGYWRAWSADTGLEVWKTTYPEVYPWGYFTIYNSAAAYGNFYGASYSGYYHCFDANTGKIKWQYFAGNTTETSMGHYTYWGAPAVSGDGKMYVVEGAQHPITSPMERGANLVCLNATTGDVIWKFSLRDGGQDPGSKAIAEGKLFITDHYTGYEFCFDKGKTATTISAPQNSVPLESTVVIRGTVKDLSPAQPNTACVSDASMQHWMEYQNLNGPIPTNATGVEVTLSVFDENNNFRDIGTATTDPYNDGFFTFAWKPDISGAFTVYATFKGTDSYWTSNAASSFVVEEASTTTQPEAAVDYGMVIYGILGAVIVAIVIGLVAVFLTLRKR